jgi:excisionase family DNA binding protein
MEEAQERLRLGRTKIYELLASGELNAVRIGWNTVFHPAELRRFLGSLPAWVPAKERRKKKG